jgi:hypothetical protein
VLTRVPALKVGLADAVALIHDNFTGGFWPTPAAAAALPAKIAKANVWGGRVYGALVGAAAAESGITLLTLDRRAVPACESLGAPFRVLGPPPADR